MLNNKVFEKKLDKKDLIKKELEQSEKYKLKTVYSEKNNEELVELSSDNVARVTAMILNNSEYKNAENPEKGIIYKKNSEEIKYIGSSSFWFKKFKEVEKEIDKKNSEKSIYRQTIENLIIAIDNENSTHLNSDKIGREAVKNRLSGLPKEKLIEKLQYPGEEYELIEIIQNPTENKENRHFSFATKFCHYACMNLFKDTEFADNYAIYDKIMKEALPKYIYEYLDEQVSYKEYENNYKAYISYIDKIIEKVKVLNKEEISRNGFDHLIWYYHKGKN